MFGYYTFTFTDEDANNTLCIFKADSRFVTSELIDTVDTVFKRSIGLDRVVLIASNPDFIEIKNALDEKAELKEAFVRDIKIKDISLVDFDEDGSFKNIENIKGTMNINSLGEIQDELIIFGIKQICLDNSVINIAPPGTQFKKMSGKTNTEFIRASDMQSGDAETSFLGFCLLKYWKDNKIDYIYVDTMSIAPMLYKLINFKRMLNPNVKIPHLISYSSYSGIQGLIIQNKDRSLVFVSASSSGSMAKDLLNDKELRAQSIITLLSYVNAPEDTQLLCNISDIRPNKNRIKPGLSTIQIVGEYFATQVKEPREVLIGAKHARDDLQTRMDQLYDQELFNIKQYVPTLSEKEIYVDGEKLIKMDEFIRWLQNMLEFYAPIHVSHIIYTNDIASKKMAEHALSFYANYLDGGSCPQLLSSDELATQENTDEVKGIIVLSAVNSKGNQLLSISRDLRDFAKNTSRTFIIGISLPKSENAFNIFKSSLIYSPNRVNHAFHTFWTLPIGERLGIEGQEDSWDLEFSLLQKDDFEDCVLAQERLKTLSQRAMGLGVECFYKSLDGRHLMLRDDFAFWKPGYSLEKNHSSSVYLTIASVLQKAREDKKLAQSDKLYSDDYQRAVLSPECFARFNDGIIQASLLRGANPIELDYSVDMSISKKMKDILIRIIQSAKKERGEALLEFLIALATKRMQLTEDDMKLIKEEIENSDSMSDDEQKYCLLLINKGLE